MQTKLISAENVIVCITNVSCILKKKKAATDIMHFKKSN